MRFHPRRALVRALIVSLLVHAALLVGVVRILPARIEAPPTVIRVVGMSRPAVPPAPPVSAPRPAPAVEAPARAEAPAPSRGPKAAARKLAVPDERPQAVAIAAAPSPPAVADVTAAAPASPAPSAAPQAGAAGAPGGAPQAAAPSGAAARQDGVGADDLRQYRFALGISARRFKRYPPLAKERGWEGTAEIALDFRRLGAEPVLSLSASSGQRILDEQALETLRQAVRHTELPEGLKGRDFRMLQQITFSLDDGG